MMFLAGILCSYFSFPNPFFSFPFLIFFSLVPLFILIYKKRTIRVIIYSFSFIFAACFFLFLPLDLRINFGDINSWLFVMISLGSSSILLAVLFGLANMFSEKSWVKRLFAFPAAWVIGQILMCYIPFLFLLPLESSLAQIPLMMQSARIFSSYSISFLIILTNMMIKECFFPGGNLSFRADRKTCSLICILFLLHILNISWGGFSLGRTTPNTKILNATLIQPCFSVSRDVDSANQAIKIKSRILQISQKALIKYPHTELLVWPEALAGYTLQDDPFRKALYQKINSKGVDLLMGGNYFNVFNKKDSMNIAFLLDKHGVNNGFYFKTRLFPFVERDYRSALAELENQTILSTSKNVKIGMMICLESLYPQYARKRAQAGADILGVLSTDTSFGNSAIPYIHMYLSALRAVENNKNVFHVGNSGPSAVFDNKGRKIIEIPFNKDDFQFAVVKI